MPFTTMSERAVVLVPAGCESAILAEFAGNGGIETVFVASLDALAAALEAGAGLAIIAEEALASADPVRLTHYLAAQPEWSDFPFILLSEHNSGVSENPTAARYSALLDNVTFLATPYHPATLASLARAALRARRRQYEARLRLEAIRDGEQRLRVALAAGKLGWWSLNLPDQELQTSPQCRAHYGRRADQTMSSADFLAAIHPDDRECVKAAMRTVLKGEGDYDVEYRVVWPDGSEHWVEAQGQIERRIGGRAVRISGVSIDTTQAKREGIALEQSEARFRAAVDAVKGVVWTNNADGRMIGEQPGWGALTGQSFDDYQGYGWAKAVHPDDAQPTIDAWQAALVTRSPFIFEHRVCTAAATWRNFAVRAIPALEADGTIREWVGVHTDITEQRAAEQALRESEEFNRRILASSNDCIKVLSLDGMLESMSPGGMEVMEIDDFGNFRGKYWPDFWPEARDLAEGSMVDARDGRIGRFRGFAETAKGTRKRWDVVVSPIIGGDGHPEKLLSISRDITAQYDTERELAELAATLEQRVVDATAELERAQASLLQSQKLETIGQLTGGVAHDFNNLLTPIGAAFEALRDRVDGDARSLQWISAGRRSAERAAELVGRLLAFARKQTLETRVVDLAQLVDGMRDLIARSIGPTIEVAIVAAAKLPAARVDANQLELSILNLCINARDAMPDGGRLTITLAGVPDGFICLSIADTGSGMDAETARRAIEPFYTTKDVGKGTGLGLSMVHGLVAQLGGRMEIETNPGEGTTVSLWLPVGSEAIVQGDMDVVPDNNEKAQSARILLVDDEELVRFATGCMLQDGGFEVVEARSGAQAIELIDEGMIPDLLVTDQLMPGLKGSELAAELQARMPALKVLIATGYSDLPDAPYPTIGKPFMSGELIDRVRAVLEG